MKTIPSKYAGRCIAFVDEEIVASGKTSLETYRKAKGTNPDKLIKLMCVPRKREVVTLL